MQSFANGTEFETFPMCNGKAKETLEFTHRMRLTKNDVCCQVKLDETFNDTCKKALKIV